MSSFVKIRPLEFELFYACRQIWCI